MTADQRHRGTAEESAVLPTPEGADRHLSGDTSGDTSDHSASDTTAGLLESAAEIVVGAAIAPFTGGETMPMVAGIAEALEGSVDRLTHLGRPVDEGEPPTEDEEEPPA